MSLLQTIVIVIFGHLFACISPGPDFAMVTRNALLYPRRLALITTLGIGTGVLMHCSYCALGLAAVLIKFPVLFVIVRFVGGAYLIYLGVKGLISKSGMITLKIEEHKQTVSSWLAFRQGFFVNALNPKGIFFIFSLFILVAKLQSVWWSCFFVIEIPVMTVLWFVLVVFAFSHSRIKKQLLHFQKPIGKALGVFLIFFGIRLFFGA